MQEIYNILAPINLAIWIVLLIIYLVGNLTYADYYTKLAHDTREMINYIFYYQCACFFGSTIFVALAERDLYEGYRCGLAWVTGISILLYTGLIVLSTYYGFRDLKEYFGKKRGKL